MRSDAPINLLWTGGWDSTFRLLELLLIKKQAVQPFYIIDSDRRSTGVELERMDRIKGILIERDPGIKDLLLPTIYQGLADIKPNDELTQHYRNILSRQGLGSQHHWLALFAEERKIDCLEICNHKNDPAATVIGSFGSKILDNGSIYYKVEETCGDLSIYHLFKYFRFPLLPLTKKDIEQRSRDYCFYDVMLLSWFCHQPLGKLPKDAKPCGTCNTCIYTINTLGIHRVPYRSRLRHYFSKILRPRRFKILAQRQGI